MSVNDYEKMRRIGKGTHGRVYKARHRQTQEFFALKYLHDCGGTRMSALREITYLKRLKHKNLICMRGVFEVESGDDAAVSQWRQGGKYMVLDYMDFDLNNFLQHVTITSAQIKYYYQQILEGLDYCHAQNIIHRDLKPANVLINRRGEVKIADFGLSRAFVPDRRRAFTNEVVTLWYRAPELLLGAKDYGPAIDVWSLGCILAEMLLCRPYMPGEGEIEQLDMIYSNCGTPTEETWPGAFSLPKYEFAHPARPIESTLRERFAAFGKNGDVADIMCKMLTLNPAHRITSADALRHHYLISEPLPAFLTC